MESLSDKKDRSDKERAEDRRQVAEWLERNCVVSIKHDGSWWRNGGCVRKAKTSEEERSDWIDSPFGWR